MEASRVKRALAADADLTRQDVLVLVLLSCGGTDVSPATVRAGAVSMGRPEVQRWNVSRDLRKLKSMVVAGRGCYSLTSKGRHAAETLVANLEGVPSHVEVVSDLEALLDQMRAGPAREFASEAVRAHRYGLHRAAVVMSWVGAVAILHQLVVDTRLADFNAEAARRNSRWKVARDADGLGKMKEGDFLDVIETLGLVGKNVKAELKVCLGLRNGAGHPNSLTVGPRKAAAHLETLIHHVYARTP